MDKNSRDKSGAPKAEADEALAERFGAFSLKMLNHTSLSEGWRINFLSNFLTGPLYRDIDMRFGLSRSGFSILFTLSQQKGLVARDIGLVTGLPKNSISRAVSELLQRDLIRRETDAEDRRAKVLALTDDGEVLLRQVVPLFEARQKAMFSALSPEEHATFNRLLMKIIRVMPDWVDPE